MCGQQSFDIAGNLTAQHAASFQNYSVRVESADHHSTYEHMGVTSDGHFVIHNLPSGNYMLRVETRAGQTVALQSLIPSIMTTHIEITLPDDPRQSTPISGTVALSTLTHPISKKALKELRVAGNFAKSGDDPHAIEHLQAALKIDPDFSEAHTNLGAAYARTNNFQAAYDEFQAAIRLGPRTAMQYCNLAIAAMGLHKPDEAEAGARKALAVDSRNPQSNYLMGRILATHPDALDSAIHHLKLALPDFPLANLVLAQIYARTGQKQIAIEALRAYEQIASPADKARTDRMIQSLR
jgi:Flp pilus assembly protein TadD